MYFEIQGSTRWNECTPIGPNKNIKNSEIGKTNKVITGREEMGKLANFVKNKVPYSQHQGRVRKISKSKSRSTSTFFLNEKSVAQKV